MAINSKLKGKRGELAWCRFCGGFGYTVRRTAQFCGNNEAGAADCLIVPAASTRRSSLSSI